MLKFKRTFDHTLPLPAYQSAGAAGMDICSAESLTIVPGGRAKVSTGWAVEIPHGFEIQVRPRSGLAARDAVTVLNSPGTIDSDYRGEIQVLLINHGRDFAHLKRGDRIAQLVLARVERMATIEGELSETERGEGGFGSTGRA